MSLSFLAAIALPLCLAPWATHRLYEQTARYKTASIAVDNAGIVLGRAGRGVLEKWRRTSSRLEAAEIVHHGLHLCARAPGPQAAACAAADKSWEAAWEARLLLVEAESVSLWLAALASAHAEGARLGVGLELSGYPMLPPVKREVCAVCGGRFRIRFLDVPASEWTSTSYSIGTRVEWGQENGQWNYRMEARHEPPGLYSL